MTQAPVAFVRPLSGGVLPRSMLAAETRLRVEIQGFSGYRRGERASVVPWLRFTPAVSLLALLAGTALASPLLVFLVASAMALGVLLPGHPWDYVYNGVVRRMTRTGPLPRSGWRRRLAFSIATPWLAATACCFHAGAVSAGYVLGVVMATLMLPLATVHLCVVSEIVDNLVGAKGRGTWVEV